MPYISSEIEVSISLLCQLFSTCYIIVQIKNCLRSTSVFKVATMANTDDFHYALKEAIGLQPPNQRFRCHQRWMERRVGHWEESTSRTAVCQKAHLGLKQR